VRSAMKRISLGKDPAFDRWLKEGRDREKRMIVAKGDASPDLSTLSARVVEAAVRIAEDDRFFACATNGCSCSLDEADVCAGNVLTFDAQWKALSAAVDALIAAREGR